MLSLLFLLLPTYEERESETTRELLISRRSSKKIGMGSGRSRQFGNSAKELVGEEEGDRNGNEVLSGRDFEGEKMKIRVRLFLLFFFDQYQTRRGKQDTFPFLLHPPGCLAKLIFLPSSFKDEEVLVWQLGRGGRGTEARGQTDIFGRKSMTKQQRRHQSGSLKP